MRWKVLYFLRLTLSLPLCVSIHPCMCMCAFHVFLCPAAVYVSIYVSVYVCLSSRKYLLHCSYCLTLLRRLEWSVASFYSITRSDSCFFCNQFIWFCCYF